jgi:hypothetical protein
MKELRAPWTHWHSMNGTIAREVFDRGSPLASDPMFAALTGAEDLEKTVRFGVNRWTRSRIAHDKAGSQTLARFPGYLRQLLWTTTVNLVSSPESFVTPLGSRFILPTSFFIDAEAFEFLGEELTPLDPLLPGGALVADEQHYRDAVAFWQLRLDEDFPDGAREKLDGDTQFAFLVPERAFEDFAVLRDLVRGDAIGARLALCLMAMDFPNPVFSPRRAALLDYAPEAVAMGSGGADFDARFVATIRTAVAGGIAADSAEVEFLTWFDLPDPIASLRTRIAAYFAALRVRLATPEGLRDAVELGASRRAGFAGRKLNEFNSTIAQASGHRALLAMDEAAQLFVKDSNLGEDFR